MKPLNEQLAPGLVIHARKLQHFTRLLHKILPVECRNHVEVANIRQKNLILVTDSPVWTTRMRQLAPQILQFINEHETELGDSTDKPDSPKPVIHHIQIQTRYHSTDKHEKQSSSRRKRPRISDKTAELLSRSANSIDDPKLQNALLKIARHNKPESDC